MILASIPADWREALGARLEAADLSGLDRLIAEQRKNHDVYPPPHQVFAALQLTPFNSVRAVILGQDPYHEPGQAHGLAFSSLRDPRPTSLINILKELREDLGYEMPRGGSLEPWARHGVLLLNSVLTVRRGKADSHVGLGWEQFTGAVIDAIAAKPGPIVFLLWGKRAQETGRFIDRTRHIVIECAHPSPYSAWRGFFGTHPFSAANTELIRRAAPPIDWNLGSSG